MKRGEEKLNPYETPLTPGNDLLRMNHSVLRQKCVQLLARRSEIVGSLWYYFKRDWRRQLAFVAAWVGVVGSLWYLGFQLLSVAFAGFGAGKMIRDIRWWKALSREWATTRELLDWQKIEEIARQ